MQTLCQKHSAHAVHLLQRQIVCLCVGAYLVLVRTHLNAFVSNAVKVRNICASGAKYCAAFCSLLLINMSLHHK